MAPSHGLSWSKRVSSVDAKAVIATGRPSHRGPPSPPGFPRAPGPTRAAQETEPAPGWPGARFPTISPKRLSSTVSSHPIAGVTPTRGSTETARPPSRARALHATATPGSLTTVPPCQPPPGRAEVGPTEGQLKCDGRDAGREGVPHGQHVDLRGLELAVQTTTFVLRAEEGVGRHVKDGVLREAPKRASTWSRPLPPAAASPSLSLAAGGRVTSHVGRA